VKPKVDYDAYVKSMKATIKNGEGEAGDGEDGEDGENGEDGEDGEDGEGEDSRDEGEDGEDTVKNIKTGSKAKILAPLAYRNKITDEVWKTVSDDVRQRTIKYKKLLDAGLDVYESNLDSLPDSESLDVRGGGPRATQSTSAVPDDCPEDRMTVDDSTNADTFSKVGGSGSGMMKVSNDSEDLTTLVRKKMVDEREQ
jgi:hypothetical protein